MIDISLNPVSTIDVSLNSTTDIDISLIPLSEMLDYELDHIEEFETDLSSSDNLEVDMDMGMLISGSKVVINPPDEPTDSMETIKVDDKTYDILEKDPTVPDWSKAPQKPSYTAGEVGAIDVDNELKYSEIDRIFNTVFGN